MDAPPDYDTPSQHTKSPALGSGASSIMTVPAVVLTAAEEKEQQRLRYQNAQGQVDSTPGRLAGGSSVAGASSGLVWQQPTYLSAVEEKEVQKRRFEEAAARVGGNPSAEGMSTGPTDGESGGMPWTHLTAAEEKDLQRKRYEEAARRAGAGVGADAANGSISSRAVSPAPSSMMNGAYSPAPGEQPIPYDAVFPSGSPSTQNRSPQPNGSMANGATTPTRGGQMTTALSDKEAMNRYYHAQDRRTSRIGSGSGNPVPASPPAIGSSSGIANRPISGSSTPPRAASSSTALSEKEAMKRYYDQQGRGDRSVVSPMANGLAAPPPFQSSSGSGPSSGFGRPVSAAPLPLDEKAQMQRYYEAIEKVNNPHTSQSGSASGSGSSSTSRAQTTNGSAPRIEPFTSASAASGGRSKPQAYLSAEEEKEQMRKRYEQASTAVARTSGQEPPQSLANGSSSSSVPPPAMGSPALPKAYLSAAEEKEQMRRRFEDAQAAVNRQSTQPGSPAAAYDSPPPPPPAFSPPYASAASGSSSNPPRSAPVPAPAPYMTAAEEKEQMRLRFENASAAVNRKSSQPAPGLASPSMGYDSPPPPVFSPSTSNNAGGSSGTTKPTPAAYMTAAEEKEAMKRRFEDATAAVDRQASQPQSSQPPAISTREISNGPSGSSSSATGAAVKPSYSSATEEKEMMRLRFESAQAAVNRGSGPGTSAASPPPRSNTTFSSIPLSAPVRQATMPGRSASIDPDAPPPPLPARPPAEYINLLSPVEAGERPPWARSAGSNSNFGMVQGQGSSSNAPPPSTGR